MPRTSICWLKCTRRSAVSYEADDAVVGRRLRVTFLYSEFEMASSRFRSIVVRIWPKPTIAFLPVSSSTSPTASCPWIRTFTPGSMVLGLTRSAFCSGASCVAALALRSARRCSRARSCSILRSMAPSSAGACSSESLYCSILRRTSRVCSLSACDSRITRIVFSIWRLASAVICWACAFASLSRRFRSALIVSSSVLYFSASSSTRFSVWCILSRFCSQ